MPYAPIIPLIMGAGLGPSITLAGSSEVTQGKAKEGGKEGGGGRIESEAEIDFICFPLLHASPPDQQPPTSPSVTPLFCVRVCGGGGTTDFLPVPSVCFSKRTSIYHFSMFCIAQALGAILANRARSSQACLLLSLTRSASAPPQTPTGLLLAHSPLLSGIHFWSSLSPVAPLSPARLQGHSSLFQVWNSSR